MIGAFGEIVFSASDKKVLTPKSLSKTVGSSWATHETIGGKPKSQYMGANLQTLQFDMFLSVEFGIAPRRLLERLEEMAEGSEVYPLVFGGKPVGNLWRLVSLSEEWGTVLNQGELISANVSVSLEEYV